MWAVHWGINNKKVSLILTLLSVASNLMVNKNTVSQVTKLLIQWQFKNSLLQFFTMFPSPAAAPIVDLFIFVFVFTLRFSVFSPFFLTLFLEVEGVGVFVSTFHLSHLVKLSLSFPPCDMECGASETTVRFKSKMGRVGVILNYWTQAETWAMDTAPDFPPLHSPPLPLSAPGVSLCSQNNAWVACLHSEGDVLYSDLVQMHPIMIMFCYLYAPPARVPLLSKCKCREQLQRLLPFSQVFTAAALLSHWWKILFISVRRSTASRCVKGTDKIHKQYGDL